MDQGNDKQDVIVGDDNVDTVMDDGSISDEFIERQTQQHVESLIRNLFKVVTDKRDRKELHINDDSLMMLQNFYPRVLAKALRLLELRMVHFVVYNKRLVPKKKASLHHHFRGRGDFDYVNKYGFVGNMGEYHRMRSFEDEIPNHANNDALLFKYQRFEQVMGQRHVVFFRDIDYGVRDNDSDDEFIRKYNTQKKYYTRREKVYRYKPNNSNRWNVNLERELGVAVNSVWNEPLYYRFYQKHVHVRNPYNSFNSYSNYNSANNAGKGEVLVRRVQKKNKVKYDMVCCDYKRWYCNCSHFQKHMAQLKDRKVVAVMGGSHREDASTHSARDHSRQIFRSSGGPTYRLQGDVVVCEHLLSVLILSHNYRHFHDLLSIQEVNRADWFSLVMEVGLGR